MTFTLTSGGGGGGSGGDRRTAGRPRRCPARCRRRTTTPAGRASAYNVTSVNGTANSYRSDGVDLEATHRHRLAGYDMGWTAAGQWFKYTVNVATAGTYTVSLRLAVAQRRSPTRCTSPTPPGTNLTRQRHRPGHRRLADLDHGHRQRHPARRRADADRRPGQRRLEHPLPRLHPGIGRRRRRRRQRPDRVLRHAGPRAGPADHGILDPGRDRLPGVRRHRRQPRQPLGKRGQQTRSGWRSTSGPRPQICSVSLLWEAAYASAFQIQVSTDNANWTTVYSTTTGTGGSQSFTYLGDRPLHPRVRHDAGDPVGRLDLRVRRLRPDHHRPGHWRQRQRRQRGLPLGQLHRAGCQPGPAGTQHHGPVGRVHAGSPATAARPTSARSPPSPTCASRRSTCRTARTGSATGPAA